MKKLICTILLGTALVGSGAWAATTGVDVAPSGVAGKLATAADTKKLSRWDLPAKQQELKALLAASPRPVFNQPEMTDVKRIENLRDEIESIQIKAATESRDYNKMEKDEIDQNLFSIYRVVRRWLPMYKIAKDKYDSELKTWETNHPDIIALEKQIKQVYGY